MARQSLESHREVQDLLYQRLALISPPEIRVDLKPVQEAGKGVNCSIPIDWSKVVPGAREEARSLCGDGCNEQACRAIEESRLRRSDKVYIWPEV